MFLNADIVFQYFYIHLVAQEYQVEDNEFFEDVDFFLIYLGVYMFLLSSQRKAIVPLKKVKRESSMLSRGT